MSFLYDRLSPAVILGIQKNAYVQETMKIIGYNLLDGMSKDMTAGILELAQWLTLTKQIKFKL